MSVCRCCAVGAWPAGHVLLPRVEQQPAMCRPSTSLTAPYPPSPRPPAGGDGDQGQAAGHGGRGRQRAAQLRQHAVPAAQDEAGERGWQPGAGCSAVRCLSTAPAVHLPFPLLLRLWSSWHLNCRHPPTQHSKQLPVVCMCSTPNTTTTLPPPPHTHFPTACRRATTPGWSVEAPPPLASQRKRQQRRSTLPRSCQQSASVRWWTPQRPTTRPAQCAWTRPMTPSSPCAVTSTAGEPPAWLPGGRGHECC